MYQAIHLVKGEQCEDSYTLVNPSKLVPALIIDGHTLSQSRAIIDYLEETRVEPKLYPNDVFLRAKCRQLADMITSDIQPVQNLRVMVKAVDDKEKRPEWAKYWIEVGFEALEKELKCTAGRFCIGDEVTVADVCLVPQVFNAVRFKVDMAKFPIISRIEAELSKLPAFIAAHPNMQPDCPELEK